MGFFFSSNYTPADFKGKSIKEITAMDPKKVDKDFLTKYAAEINEGEKALSEKQKSAIQLLIDLNDRTVIFENCYEKKATQTPQVQKQAQQPMAEEDEEQAQAEAERAQEVKFPERDERALVQGGGRRKSRRRASSKRGRKSKHSKRGGRKSKRKTSKRSSRRKTRKH